MSAGRMKNGFDRTLCLSLLQTNTFLSFTMNVCFHPSDPEQAAPGLREEQSSDPQPFPSTLL
jgi:hypothetical protein